MEIGKHGVVFFKILNSHGYKTAEQKLAILEIYIISDCHQKKKAGPIELGQP